jgi:hypothetical protein
VPQVAYVWFNVMDEPAFRRTAYQTAVLLMKWKVYVPLETVIDILFS